MRKELCLALSLFFVFLTNNALANLVANGSFELGDYNNTDLDSREDIMLIQEGMTNITGWSVTGDNGVHWLSYAGAATDGNYSVDLQGENPPGELSAFWTEFSTVTGNTYKLSFDAFTGNVVNTATVSAGSLINQIFNGGGPVAGDATYFLTYEYIFTAIDSVTRLTFNVVSTDGYGPVVDNVSVVDTNPVPEPSSFIIFGFGVIGLARQLRKNNR